MKKVFFILTVLLSFHIQTSFAQKDSEEIIVIGFKGQKEMTFKNDDELRSWAMNDSERSIFIEKLDEIARQQKFAAEMGYLDNEEATDQYTKELLYNSSSKKSMPTKDYILSINAIWDDTNFGGSFIPFGGGFVPSLLYMNDRGSSVAIIMGGIALCDKTWFRGKKVFILGAPGITVSDLGSITFNFDNTASSAFGF